MATFSKQYRLFALLAALSAPFLSNVAVANGEITDQVNHLHEHIGDYTEEVHWLHEKFGGVVNAYEKQGKGGVDTHQMIEFWEEVNFHSAIETQYVPIYATIWQGIYGVKQAIDEGADIATVREQEAKLQQALWQALGAVKLAAQYQQKGLVKDVQTTASEPTSGPAVVDDIKQRLHRVVAKYAEQLSEVATTLVHDTYMERFEGIEGALIEQDAALVEELEKDFNVTLPQAIENDAGVDSVRNVVESMQTKLDKARSLLVKAEENSKAVF